ncbi:MAG TPA: ABC transporter permease [Acidimicrobiia bacterium]|nr:ABC transporter permease [Acidimicrobiia bacterium]
MSDLWPYLVVGITAGSLYGLAGTGLVLTYKTSGVFNFAHGAVAAVAAYLFYELHYTHGVAWPVALVVTTVGFAVVAGAVLEQLARRLADVGPVGSVVATVGLLVAIQAAIQLIAGGDVKTFPPFLPTSTFRLGGVNVEWGQLATVVLAAGIAGGTGLYLRVTRLGMAMRAVVDAPDLLAISGSSPVRVRRTAWMIGSALAAVTGVLIAPALGLEPFLLTLLVVQAFGAAAIGRFTNLTGTFLGGLLMGVLAAVATRLAAEHASLAGLPSSVPFLMLFAALLVTRKGSLVEWARPSRERAAGPGPVGRWNRPLAAAAVIVVLVAPHVVGSRLPTFTSAAAFVVMFLSLALLTSTSGQVSLCHAAFAAVGASTMAHLTTGAGLPWALALIGAGAAAVPLGIAVSLPAIRLSGIYLALATFAFGILMQRIVFNYAVMFGHTGARTVARPSFGGPPVGDVAYFYVVAAAAAVTLLVVAMVIRARLGRALRALGDSPVALSTAGASVNVTLVLVFCLSAFLAGVAGALMAGATGVTTAVSFGPFQSLIWLAVLGIFGRGLVRPALLAALAFTLPATYLGDLRTEWLNIGFGVLAIWSVAAGRVDTAAWVERLLARTERRMERSPVTDRLRVADAGAGPIP